MKWGGGEREKGRNGEMVKGRKRELVSGEGEKEWLFMNIRVRFVFIHIYNRFNKCLLTSVVKKQLV